MRGDVLSQRGIITAAGGEGGGARSPVKSGPCTIEKNTSKLFPRVNVNSEVENKCTVGTK